LMQSLHGCQIMMQIWSSYHWKCGNSILGYMYLQASKTLYMPCFLLGGR
jgi:hypothetical protein